MSTRDALDFGEQLPPGRGRRAVALFASLVFTLAIFGTAIVDTAFPIEEPKLIGAERAEREAARRDATLWDGSLVRVFEDDLRDRSRVRQAVLPTYAFFKYVYLSEGTEDVLVGADQWLFIRNRVELAPYEDAWLANLAANLFTAIDRRFASLRYELVLIPIPRKAWVAQDFLPRGVDAQLAVDDGLIDGLLERGIVTADLRPIYSSRDPEEIYFKADTHWTPTGSWLAAEAAASLVFPELEEAQRLGRVKISVNSESRQANDLLRSLGVDYPAEDLGLLSLRDPLRYTLRFPKAIEAWYEQPTAEVRQAHAGTSFSHQQNTARSLAHFSGEKVWNGALPALPFLGTTVRLMNNLRKAEQLERVYIEFPIGPTFNYMRGTEMATFGTRAGPLFAKRKPPEVVVVGSLPKPWRNYGGDEVVAQPGKSPTFVEIPGGLALHDGRGALSLVLRGKLDGAPLDLEIRSAGHRLIVALPEGAVDVVLPVISAGTSTEKISLVARSRGPARLRVDELALAHERAPGKTRKLAPQVTPQKISFSHAETATLGRRASLLIALGNGVPKNARVHVEVFTSASAKPRLLTFEDVQPSARVFIDLGDAAGASFERVELHAPGARKTATLAKSAQLFGLE